MVLNQTGLRPLSELIEPRPKRPETALTLENAISDPLGTIEAFELPPSVKKHFEMVLDAVAEGRGRAFWVQSEYGGGKTHFIAALTALLGHSPDGEAADERVWSAVNDDEVRSRAPVFVPKRILPVAISCKGITPIDGQYSRSLLRLLMDGMAKSLAAHGLEESIPITSSQELLKHFHDRPPDLRTAIDAWCKQRHGISVTELYEIEGPEHAARVYLQWCREVAGAEPDIDLTVLDWLTTFSVRLEAAGFDGLLVVIDEFATLQNLAKAEADVAAYEDILEALGWLVPQRLAQQQTSSFAVYTIVASQRGHPVKLAERFTNLPLLAHDAARDYEVIVSRRVRTLQKDRLPEIDQYYHQHKLTHNTYATMPPERFREVFPFQPQVFDAIWHITASGGDVASARFGIAAVWDTIKQPGVLEFRRLLTVSDLLQSTQFQNDLKASPLYRDAFVTYEAASESARSLGFTDEEHKLAQQVLDALFVDYLAYHRSPRWLSTEEIAEAILATSSSAWIPPKDQVLVIVGRLRQLRQVEFEPSQGARFKADAGTGPSPAEILAKTKQEIDDADARLARVWCDLLHATQPSIGMWSDQQAGVPKPIKALHGRVQYQGVVEVRASFAKGQQLADLSYSSGRHFHIIILTTPVEISPDDLDDPRIAVVVPGPLQTEEIELCRNYVACQLILENTTLMGGPEGPSLRAFVDEQRKEAARKLIERQVQVYRRGQIVCRTGVAFNPDSVFHAPSPKVAIDTIADRLLGAAYDQRDQMIRSHQFKGNSRLDPSTDTGKIFGGLIGESTQSADLGAAQNFGPALGLSRPMAPNLLSLDQDHFGIALVLQRVTSAGRDGIPTENLYETLCGVPYGVPHEIVTLWLLACVRMATVEPDKRHVEIELQKNAKVRLKDGSKLPNGAISFLNVKNLDWSSSLRTDFLSIKVSEEVPFGTVVEYAQVFDRTLRVPSVPDQVIAEEQRLQHVISQVRARVADTRASLEGFASAFGQALPHDVTTTMEQLAGALTFDGEYQREQLLGQLKQAFPSVSDLDTAWGKAQDWMRLSKHAAELTSSYQFLRNLVSRLSANPGRYQSIVTKATLEVLPRLSLPELLASPSVVESVVNAARDIRAAYENEYRIHHRDYFAEIARLGTQLDEVKRRATILAQLNKLKCAGPPTLTDPVQRLSLLEARLRVCPFATSTDIVLGGGLTCQHDGCELPGLDPLAVPPTEEINTLRHKLDEAIRDRVSAVKARAISAILEKSNDPNIGTFLAVIQAGQLDGLLEVLDDKLVELIDRILEEERVRVVPTSAIANVAKRFNTIQRSQIDEVTAALREELTRAFAELEQAHPGAVIQLRLAWEADA